MTGAVLCPRCGRARPADACVGADGCQFHPLTPDYCGHPLGCQILLLGEGPDEEPGGMLTVRWQPAEQQSKEELALELDLLKRQASEQLLTIIDLLTAEARRGRPPNAVKGLAVGKRRKQQIKAAGRKPTDWMLRDVIRSTLRASEKKAK